MDEQTELKLDLPEAPLKPKTNLFKKIAKILGWLFLSLILVVLLSVTAGIIYIRTESGQAFLQEQVNEALKEPLAAQGLSGKVTSLSGQLPLELKVGLELADAKGKFLTAKEASFDIGFSLSPLGLKISHLVLSDLNLERMPKLKESPPKEETPSEPLTADSLKVLLANLRDSLIDLPSWLPEVHLEEMGLKKARLGAPFIGQALEITCLLGLDFVPKKEDKLPAINFRLTKAEIKGQDLELLASLSWGSGVKKDNFLEGELKSEIKAKASLKEAQLFKNDSKSESKVSLFVNLKGALLAPNLKAQVLLDSLNLEGQKLEDFNLKLLGSPLDLASFLRLKEARALALNLAVTGKLNNKPLSLNLPLYASLLTNDYQSLKCGVRDLNLQALGLEARATLETLLGSLKSPQIKGELKASIKDWQQIGALVPDFKLEGEVETLATLNYDQGQKANVNLNIPHFKVKNKEEALLNLAHLQLNLSLEDLFKVPAFKTTLTSQSIAAGPLLIATEAKAKGSLTGPIDLSLKTSGNLETSLGLQYEKDKVKINTLQVLVATSLLNLKAENKSLNQAASRPKSKAKAPKNQSNRNRRASSKSQKETQSLKVASLRHIGLRLTSPTELTFNDQGINLKNTQVALLPSGSLNAALGLNPQKFGADVNLKGLDLTPWKGLIKEIPEGLIEAELKLHGSPKDPRGNLRLGVSKLKVDRVPLEPLDLALTGQITNQKSLNLKLDLPASSLSKIGLEALNLQASLPLIFAENGVPNVHLKGNLSGQVKIKGRLAKLWKLAPLPEYRLTGDLDGDIRVAGTLEALKVNGGVKIQGGRFEDPINGLLLRDLGLMVDLDGKVAGNNLGGGVKINGGFSDGMGGTFTLKGQTSLDASKIDIATKIDHLRPLRRNDVRISLSGDTKITGSAADPYISGTIVVDNGALQLENVEAGPSGVSTLPITTKEEIPKAKEEAKPKAESLQKEGAGGGRINLAIKSPGKFLVDGFGLTSAWQTDLKVTGPLTNPLISGEISCVKGNLDFLNKDFVMEKGVVTLAGGNVANPIIDMLLTNTTADFTSHIRIAGTVKKLKLTLSSEPEMPQDDVLAHILFGRNANELGRYEALQLAAAVARMGSGLGSGLNNPRKSLGMDVMRLKSGGNNNGKDDTGMSGMALETGKYLTDSLYVGVEQGAKEGSSAGIVQLEITPKLKLELRSQQNNTKGSLNWKYNF